jgi:GTP pyrophosphokinase
MRREGLPVQKLTNSPVLTTVAEQLNYADLDALHAAIGEDHVSAKAVVQRMQRELRGGEEQLPVTVAAAAARAEPQERRRGVHVEGLDDVMVRLSRCCTPVPGDEIMGFVTRGRGVSVHRTDCANALSLRSQADACIDVEWDTTRPATTSSASRSRRSIAPSCCATLPTCCPSTTSTSVVHLAGRPTGSRALRFEFELADPGHLDSILSAVKRIDSVYDAARVLAGYPPVLRSARRAAACPRSCIDTRGIASEVLVLAVPMMHEVALTAVDGLGGLGSRRPRAARRSPE